MGVVCLAACGCVLVGGWLARRRRREEAREEKARRKALDKRHRHRDYVTSSATHGPEP